MTSLTLPQSLNTLGSRLLARFAPLAFSGPRPGDTEDERLQKALLMGGSLIIAPIALTWAALYAIFGEWTAALLTLAYAAADVAGVVRLCRTGRPALLRWVQKLCEEDRIKGAVRFSRVWMIPKEAEKPVDGRRKSRS